MSSQEKILVRVRSALAHLPNVSEKKMFGKLAFMVNNKLCIAVGKEEIMCRIDPSLHDSSITKKGCKPVVMRGKEMKGYVYINNLYLLKENEVEYWIDLCLEINKKIAKQLLP